MNATFWNLYSNDSAANCGLWTRSPANPVIPAEGETWKSVWTANPDVLEVNGRRLLYYRGNGSMSGRDDGNHDRIGVAEILSVTRDGIRIRDLHDTPVIDVGAPGRFDDQHVLDPAALAHCGTVLVFFSAVGAEGDRVGLAMSHDDGENFWTFGNIFEGRAPEVVVKDGILYLLFQREVSGTHYETFLAKSPDGIQWEMIQDEPVLAPGPAGSWNSVDVCTARVAEADGVYTMLYAGSASKWDVPDAFGLARSTDLVNWEHHPGNPIFRLGDKDAPDGGGIWFPALLEEDDFFAMLYEGTRADAVTSQLCQASIEK